MPATDCTCVTLPGSGRTVTTLTDYLANNATYNVRDFGAAGDGVTDDTAAIQAACDAATTAGGGEVVFPAGSSYVVTDAITVGSGTTVRLNGSTLTQTTADTELLNVEGRSDVTITGGRFVGYGSDFMNSDSSRAVAIYGGMSGARIWVTYNTFTGFTYTPVRFKEQSDCVFAYNTVVGPGAPTLTPVTSGASYGVLFDANCVGGVIHGNSLSGHAQGIMVQVGQDIHISDNRIAGIVGQHGMYLHVLRGLTVIGNTVDTTSLQGIKVQVYNDAPSELSSVTIIGNTVTDSGSHAILITSANAEQGVQVTRGATITGNVVRNSGACGLVVDTAVSVTISGNTVDTAEESGIRLSRVQIARVQGNTLRTMGLTAIRDLYDCQDVVISDNLIVDPATSETLGDRFGIFVANGSSARWTIDGNIVRDTGTKMEYGVFIANLDQSTLCVRGNVVPNASVAAARFVANGPALLAYHDNVFPSVANEPPAPSVASAATITLPGNADTVTITGTTGITSISPAANGGRRVTLVFAGAVTVTDGSNLKLASSFTSTADDTLTLACDGVNWYEVGRSVN